jgi:hypothetical protein
MADTSLSEALQGIYTQPGTTPWGLGAMTLAQTTPALINPYGSAGANFGIALGSGLISALLGYQAKKQAMEENLALQPFITRALEAETPEALDVIMQQPGAGALADVGTQLKLSLIANKAAEKKRQTEFGNELMLQLAKEQGIVPKGFENLVTMPEVGQLTPKEQRELSFEAAKEKQKQEAVAPQKQKEEEIKMSLELGQRAAQNPVVKKYQDLNLFNKELQKVAKNPTRPAVDKMIVLFNKMTDPTSVTTLGEFYMAENMQSALDRYRANLSNLTSSNPRLREQAVKEVLTAADTILSAAGDAYNDQVKNFVQQGHELGFPTISPNKIGLPLHGSNLTNNMQNSSSETWQRSAKAGLTTTPVTPQLPSREEALAELARRRAARGQ